MDLLSHDALRFRISRHDSSQEAPSHEASPERPVGRRGFSGALQWASSDQCRTSLLILACELSVESLKRWPALRSRRSGSLAEDLNRPLLARGACTTPWTHI